MANFSILIICLILGIVFRRTKIFPENTHRALNAIIINISLPAITLLYIQSFKFSFDIIFPVLMPWLLFVLAFFVFKHLGKRINLDKKTIGCLILLVGLGNTSFLGLPMIEVFFGKEGIPVGLVIDQFGSFLVLSTLGILVADYYSGKYGENQSLFKKILTFPPFISIIVALFLTTIEYPDIVSVVLERLGLTLSPLALLSVGFQLKIEQISEIKRELFYGLSAKLILFPIFIFFIYLFVLDTNSLYFKITIFEAAMPPMITAAIIASEYELNPKLANLLVGLGIIISFATLSIWYLVLRF